MAPDLVLLFLLMRLLKFVLGLGSAGRSLGNHWRQAGSGAIEFIVFTGNNTDKLMSQAPEYD